MDSDNREPGQEQAKVFKVASPGGRRAFLHALSKTAAVGGAAVAADNCKSGPTAPTATTSTTTTSTTTTTSSTTSTTTLQTSTLAGVVTDSSSGRPILGARVSVVDGPGAGRSSSTDGNGYYSIAGIGVSSFTARATASGYNNQDQGLTLARDTRLDFSLRPIPTTSTTSTVPPTTTSTGGNCTCNTVGTCTCNTVCTCNPLTYFYPN